MKKAHLVFLLGLLAVISAIPGCSGSQSNTQTSTPPPTTIYQPKPASFSVTSIVGPTAPVTAGVAAPVTVIAANSGELSGTYSAVLKVNGVDYKTQDVTLNGGESKSVVFQVTEPKQGTYALSAGAATATMTVMPLPMSQATLTLADVGHGYVAISSQDMNIDPSAVTSSMGVNASDWFGFGNASSPDTFNFVFGFKAYPLSAVQQLQIDSQIFAAQTNPTVFVSQIQAQFGSIVTKSEILPAFNRLGDKSLGIRVYMTESGINFAFDYIFFREADTVTYFYLMWMPDTLYQPATDILVNLLDSKEKTVIASR